MKRLKRSIRKNAVVLFLLPSLAAFSVFYVIPFFGGLRYAFLDKPVNGRFVWFDNFAALFGNETFLLALRNTLIFIWVSVPLNVFFPLVLALMIRRAAYGGLWFRNVFLSPLVVPVAAVAFFWRLLLAENGPANYYLGLFGIEAVDFLNGRYALFSVVLIYLWRNIGYNLIIFLAALTGIPQNYYDAARTETSNPVKTLFYVTMPSLTPTMFFVIVISIINCFKAFREIYTLSGARPPDGVFMLQHFMNNMFGALNYSRLTAAAFITAAGIMCVIYALFVIDRKNHETAE